MATTKLLAGIAWPFTTQGRGLPGSAFGTAVIKSAAILLLKTRKRTRVFNPEVGTQLLELLFETEGPILDSLIIREIASAFADQLPQVNVVDIQINDDGSRIDVNVKYVIQGVRDETGFVNVGTRG